MAISGSYYMLPNIVNVCNVSCDLEKEDCGKDLSDIILQ